jgi:hypothetical protein
MNLDKFSNDSFTLDDMRQVGDYVKAVVKKEALSNRGSVLACIVEKVDAAYLCRTSDGKNIAGVIATDESDWQPNTWVTLEETEDGYTIAGIGSYDGGPLPDQVGA